MKKIITIICFLSLMSSANAKGDIGGDVIKYGVIAAGVGVLAVTAQGIKEKINQYLSLGEM